MLGHSLYDRKLKSNIGEKMNVGVEKDVPFLVPVCSGIIVSSVECSLDVGEGVEKREGVN